LDVYALLVGIILGFSLGACVIAYFIVRRDKWI